MKTIIDRQWTIETRANNHQPWARLYYDRTSYAQARQRTKTLVKEIQWRIVMFTTVRQVVKVKPKSKTKQPRRQMCKTWPRCACVARGTVEDCRSRTV